MKGKVGRAVVVDAMTRNVFVSLAEPFDFILKNCPCCHLSFPCPCPLAPKTYNYTGSCPLCAPYCTSFPGSTQALLHTADRRPASGCNPATPTLLPPTIRRS